MPTAAELAALVKRQYPDDFDTWYKDFFETEFPHYFQLLEVDPDSITIEDDIEKNYRRLIQAVHPDRSPAPEAAAKAAMLNRARDTLRNKYARQGYFLFLQFVASAIDEAKQAKAQRDGTSTAAGASGAAASPPRLEVEPARFTPPEPLVIGKKYEVRLRVRNTGGPADPALFQVRTPRHASHPRPEPRPWLYLEQEPAGVPGPLWMDVPLTIDTTHLRPKQTYSESVYVVLSGQDKECLVAFTTAQPARGPAPQPGPIGTAPAPLPAKGAVGPAAPAVSINLSGRALALGGAAVATVVVLGLFVLRASGSNGGTPTPRSVAAPNNPPAAQGNAVVSAQHTQPTQPPPVQTATQPPPVRTPPPTPTPTATPTPLPDTPAGTVLDAGQTWHQGGIALAFAVTAVYPGEIQFRLRLTNERADQVIWRVLDDTFIAADSTGKGLKMDATYAYIAGSQGTIGPGQSDGAFPVGAGSRMSIFGDFSRPAVTEVIFSVTTFSSISNARWRVPINH